VRCLRSFRETYHRDNTSEEVDKGTPALQKELLAEGNADVCQIRGKEREGGWKFYGTRENTKCRRCYVMLPATCFSLDDRVMALPIRGIQHYI
jgi:hypothetical protein